MLTDMQVRRQLSEVGLYLLNRTLEAMETPRTANDEDVSVYADDTDLMPRTVHALEQMAARPNAPQTDDMPAEDFV